jgi:hypothetical protein
MPRLIYGILSLILGSMALLLPETKKFPLPRTMLQVEVIPTSISQSFRRQRSVLVKRNIRPDGTRREGTSAFSDGGSTLSGVRSNRLYDNQSTLHSVYELQEFGQDDTVHSITNRNSSRRSDPRNTSLYQPYSGINSETYRQPQSIAEDVECDDDVNDDDRIRVGLQRHLDKQQQQQQSAVPNPIILTNGDVMILPVTTSINKQSSLDAPSQLEVTAQIQAGHITGDRNGLLSLTDGTKDINQDDNLSQSPKYRRTMSQDENYFSEHC